MKFIRIFSIAVMVSLLGLAVVSAQDAGEKKKPTPEEKAVKGRQELMHVLAAQRGVLRAMADGKRPTDAVAFANSANAIAALSKVIPEAFTLNAIVGKSTAKPDIWTNQADFSKKATELSDKAAKVATLAVTDIEGAKAMVKDIKECGGCHDAFRVEEEKK